MRFIKLSPSLFTAFSISFQNIRSQDKSNNQNASMNVLAFLMLGFEDNYDAATLAM